eukprot:COSAG01_NODE_2866_length_6949_cov_4.994599_4_plen_217_part_00
MCGVFWLRFPYATAVLVKKYSGSKWRTRYERLEKSKLRAMCRDKGLSTLGSVRTIGIAQWCRGFLFVFRLFFWKNKWCRGAVVVVRRVFDCAGRLFLRVHWVAVPRALRARRANRSSPCVTRCLAGLCLLCGCVRCSERAGGAWASTQEHKLKQRLADAEIERLGDADDDDDGWQSDASTRSREDYEQRYRDMGVVELRDLCEENGVVRRPARPLL